MEAESAGARTMHPSEEGERVEGADIEGRKYGQSGAAGPLSGLVPASAFEQPVRLPHQAIDFSQHHVDIFALLQE